MSDETPTYKRYVVTSPVTINPAGPDEPPVILEMVQERGEIGIANGYLELAPKAVEQLTAAVEPEPEKKAAASKPTASKETTSAKKGG